MSSNFTFLKNYFGDLQETTQQRGKVETEPLKMLL